MYLFFILFLVSDFFFGSTFTNHEDEVDTFDDFDEIDEEEYDTTEIKLARITTRTVGRSTAKESFTSIRTSETIINPIKTRLDTIR